MISSLRPLTMGELIDRAASFWKRHWRSLFVLSLGFNLTAYVVSRVYQFVLPRISPLLANPAQMEQVGASEPIEVLVQAGAMLLTLVLLLGVSNYLGVLFSVAATEYALPQLLSNPSSVPAAFARVRRRLGTTTAAYLLTLVWAILAFVLSTLPGALLAVGIPFLGVMLDVGGAAVGLLVLPGMAVLVLGWIGVAVWYLLRFLVLAQVIAAEDVGPLAALRRCGALLSGRIGPGLAGWVKVRASIVVTAMLLMLLVISSITGLPGLILQFVFRDPNDPFGANLPLGATLLQIGAELFGVIGQAAFGPLYTLLAVVLYLDLRVRREGLDLELQLNTLEGRS